MNVAYKDKKYLDLDEAVTSIHDMISDTTMKLFLMSDEMLKRSKRGAKVTKEEWVMMEDMRKAFKYQMSTYMDLIRMGLIEKRVANPKLEEDILKAVRDQESSIGDIVRKIPGSNK
jgi:hypothetical protein